MNPNTGTRTEIRRDDDDELLGFVAPSDDSWSALAVFGGLLGTYPSEDEAEDEVRRNGLASLAERWWIDVGNGWERCCLVEAAPDRLVAVVAYYPFMAERQVIAPGTPLQYREPAGADHSIPDIAF
jgi:hypothetical protein